MASRKLLARIVLKSFRKYKHLNTTRLRLPDQKKLKRSFLSSEQTHAGMWTKEATYQTRDNAKELATRAFPVIGKRPAAPRLQTTVNRIHAGKPVYLNEIAMTDINPKDLHFVEGPNDIDRGSRRMEPPRATPPQVWSGPMI